MEYTRSAAVARATNAARHSSKTGRNIAPNALAIFLQTPAVGELTLPLFFNSAFAASSVAQAADSASSRALTSESSLSAVNAALEALDESGAVTRSLDQPYYASQAHSHVRPGAVLASALGLVCELPAASATPSLTLAAHDS